MFARLGVGRRGRSDTTAEGRPARVAHPRPARWLAFLLTLALTAAACGTDGATPDAESADDDQQDAAAPGDGADDAPDDEPCLTAAFVFQGPVDVPGWNGAAADGVDVLDAELPCVDTRVLENVTEGTEAERVFTDLAEEGFDAVFGTTFGYMETMVEVSSQYPDIYFEHASGYLAGDNMSNYFGAGYEGTYLLGIAAASVTESKQLGWVGSFPVPDVLWDLNAFTMGARSVDPDITVQIAWTSHWYDPVAEKQAAESLIDAGIDVVGQSGGSPSIGEAAEQAGVFWVPTLDEKQEPWGPTTMLGVRHYNWGAAYVHIVQSILDGTWTNEPYFGTLADGFIEVKSLHDDVPDDVRSDIDETGQQIIDGSLEIWEGPILDNEGDVVVAEGDVATREDLSGAQFLVEGVVGTIPS